MLANFNNFVNRIKEFWQEHRQEIILFIAIVLISLLSFAAGFIVAKIQEREPLKIIESPTEAPPEGETTF